VHTCARALAHARVNFAAERARPARCVPPASLSRGAPRLCHAAATAVGVACARTERPSATVAQRAAASAWRIARAALHARAPSAPWRSRTASRCAAPTQRRAPCRRSVLTRSGPLRARAPQAHKPTSVTHSVVGRFTGAEDVNLILACAPQPSARLRSPRRLLAAKTRLLRARCQPPARRHPPVAAREGAPAGLMMRLQLTRIRGLLRSKSTRVEIQLLTPDGLQARPARARLRSRAASVRCLALSAPRAADAGRAHLRPHLRVGAFPPAGARERALRRLSRAPSAL